MAKSTRYIGLDVHAGSNSVAIADPGRKSEVRYLGTIPNSQEGLKKLLKKLGSKRHFATWCELERQRRKISFVLVIA